MGMGEADWVAGEILRLAGHSGEQAPNIAQVCRDLLGAPPRLVPIACEAALVYVAGCHEVWLRPDVPAERARWLVAHELAEWWHLRTGYQGDDVESRCDAVGAALVAPRPAFVRAVERVGHSVHLLASAFAVPQALAMLRVGEVTGRPVLLLRRPRSLHRGQPYQWTRRDLAGRHAQRIRLDGTRWGLVASAWPAPLDADEP